MAHGDSSRALRLEGFYPGRPGNLLWEDLRDVEVPTNFRVFFPGWGGCFFVLGGPNLLLLAAKKIDSGSESNVVGLAPIDGARFLSSIFIYFCIFAD